MSKASAWMPLYIGDYLADTMHLGAEEHGAYLLLLMHQWRTGPLPNDDKQLAAIARVQPSRWTKEVGHVVRSFFTVTVDGLVQKRLDFERTKTSKKVEAKTASGSAGGHSKWGTSASDDRRTRADRLATARKKGRHTEAEWKAIVAHCGNRCLRCGSDGQALTRDHIIPISTGGSDGIENIQPLCRQCNAAKGPDTTDLRPDGWQDAGMMSSKMPSENAEDAYQTPTQSQSPTNSPTGEISIPFASLTATQAPPTLDEPDIRTVLFSEGLTELRRVTGKPDGPSRALIGRMLRDCGDDAARVRTVIHEAADLRPADPVAWLTAAIRPKAPPNERPLARSRGERLLDELGLGEEHDHRFQTPSSRAIQ